jgi:hypothetical protein
MSELAAKLKFDKRNAAAIARIFPKYWAFAEFLDVSACSRQV